jgi:hypothetical protein
MRYLIILLLIPSIGLSQSFETRRNQFFIGNVITAGVIGGVGSAIHKKEGQSRGKAFLSGFWKGCIGGSLTLTGKYLTYEITRHENYAYGWPAKIVHATGASIIENAAQNKPLWDNWAVDFGPVRFDINQKGKALVRLQPFKLVGIGYNILQGNSLLIKNSILTGSMTFSMKDTLSVGNIYTDNYSLTVINRHEGYNLFNTMTINYTSNMRYKITAHEMIHIFQEREFLSINNIYFNNKYKWIYFDFPVSNVIYSIAKIGNIDYYNNIFELESESFATQTSVLKLH